LRERAHVAERPLDRGLFLALAPMDGVTDWVHRELATQLGGVSQCVSEFIRVTDAPPPAKVFLRDCPELLRGGRTRSGVPVFVQILGGDPAAMAAAARTAAELGAPGVDINFGCPAKRVNNHDGGASILRCPERAEHITRAVRDALPTHIPVTAKIRLGWADSAAVVDIARAAEQGGAAWLTIHGRTKAQMYAPPVDYAAIGRARAALSIKVVANGDIACVATMLGCAAQSGATAFMVGRAALAYPYLFRELRGETSDTWREPAAYVEVLLRYLGLMQEAGFSPDAQLRRLKQWLGLARVVDPKLGTLFDRLKRTELLAEALAVLAPVRSRAA
jgi:tRNA-dihydrouridine synthase C